MHTAHTHVYCVCHMCCAGSIYYICITQASAHLSGNPVFLFSDGMHFTSVYFHTLQPKRCSMCISHYLESVFVCSFCFKWEILRKDFIYLLLDRGRRESGRETSVCGCFLCAPYWGRGLACNPGMCPSLGIELATLRFAGQHSFH